MMHSIVMMSVSYAKGHIQDLYADCHYADCRSAECCCVLDKDSIQPANF